MDFQYFNIPYTKDGFHQDQGVQYIFTDQAGGNYFHGVAPTTGSGAISQPAFWPAYHGYQPQQHHGVFEMPTALPQFQPVTEIPTFHPIPSQGHYGMTGQDGAVYFDPWLQGPGMHVGAMGQQFGTSVVLHPELQVPLVAVGGAGPQYGAYVPGPYAPHLQEPVMFVDAIGQQHGTAVPFQPQLQAPFTWVDVEGLQHGTSVPFGQYQQAPMDATGLQPLTTVPFSPVPAPILEPLQPLIGNTQLPRTGLQAAGPSITGLMSPAPMEEPTVGPVPAPSLEPLQPLIGNTQLPRTGLQAAGPSTTGLMSPAPMEKPTVGQVPHTVPTGECLRPQVVTSTGATETKKAQIGPQVTDNSLASGTSLPENATKRKYRKRKQLPVVDKTLTMSSDGENKGPDTSSDSAQKSRSKRARRSPVYRQPRRKPGEHMVHPGQVFHQLGVRDSARTQPSRIPMGQSRPSAAPPKTRTQAPPAPVQQVRHYYKNHANGSIANYGDGEVVVYQKPAYPGMFPLPLINPEPQRPGGPRRFHCREYSIPTKDRAQREAMKREAQLKREQEAQVTRSGMDCSVLADRKHLPYDPWPTEDNWWETGLDDVWKLDECQEYTREDVL